MVLDIVYANKGRRHANIIDTNQEVICYQAFDLQPRNKHCPRAMLSDLVRLLPQINKSLNLMC